MRTSLKSRWNWCTGINLDNSEGSPLFTEVVLVNKFAVFANYKRQYQVNMYTLR